MVEGERKALTSTQLLQRVMSPEHPSQAQFALTRNGKMLPTCVQNGFTYEGRPIGSGRDPYIVQLRMETELHKLATPDENNQKI